MLLTSTPNNLATFSFYMARVTFFIIVIMLIVNASCWFFPELATVNNGYGLSFALTSSALSSGNIVPSSLSIWQMVGGIIVTSIPLLALSRTLYALSKLFYLCGQKAYFSSDSASYLGKAGSGVILWVVLDFVSEPILSMWLTMGNAAGERLITLSFTSGYLVALYLAACIMIIARILRRAYEVNAENQSFV